MVDFPRRDENRPRFSPDGSRIAFESLDGAGRITIFIASASGANARKLTADAAPSWRP